MRPALLNPLFSPATSLPGLGPKTVDAASRAVRHPAEQDLRVLDLLFHLPSGTIDRRKQSLIINALPGELVVLKLTIDEHRPPHRSSRAPYRVIAHDESSEITLTFFGQRGNYLSRSIPEGSERYVAGKIELFDGMLQIVHPDFMLDERAFKQRASG